MAVIERNGYEKGKKGSAWGRRREGVGKPGIIPVLLPSERLNSESEHFFEPFYPSGTRENSFNHPQSHFIFIFPFFPLLPLYYKIPPAVQFRINIYSLRQKSHSSGIDTFTVEKKKKRLSKKTNCRYNRAKKVLCLPQAKNFTPSRLKLSSFLRQRGEITTGYAFQNRYTLFFLALL